MLSATRRSYVNAPAPRRTIIRDRHGNNVVFSYDAITERNAKLAVGLDRVHLDKVSSKVNNGIRDGMSTADLDQMSIDVAVDLGLSEDPQYLELSSGIAWSNHVKSTPDQFRKFVLIAKENNIADSAWADFCLSHADELEAIMKPETDLEVNDPLYLRDRYSYTAFRMLVEQYFFRVAKKDDVTTLKRGSTELQEKPKLWVLERPSYMLMRVAVYYYMPDLAAIERCVTMMYNRWFTPATPALQYAGAVHPNLASCFVAGTEVLTTAGVKRIEDVAIGDRVITHTGAIQAVTQLHTNKLGQRQLFALQCFRTPKVLVTGNHKVWAISDLNTSPRWVAVDQLTSGHHIAVPKRAVGETQPEFDLGALCLSRVSTRKHVEYEVVVTDHQVLVQSLTTLPNPLANDPTQPRTMARQHGAVHRFLRVTPEFANALGMWYGDGCVQHSKHKKDGVATARAVGLVCQVKNQLLIEFWAKEMSNATGLLPSWHDAAGLRYATFHSVMLAECFEDLFGSGFAGKRIHPAMFGWDSELVRQFMCGLMSTDGCVSFDGTMTIGLSNPPLVKEIYHWVRSTGQDISYMHFGPKLRPGATAFTATIKLPRAWIQPSDIFKVYDDDRMSKVAKPTPKQRTLYVNGQAFVGVDKLEVVEEDLPELVYTLGVESDHSYNVEGLVVENCFLWSVVDSMPSIMRSWVQNATISSRGGGLGGDIDAIRPKNSVIHSSQGLTSSIVNWVTIWEAIAKAVNQGGKRAGSCALYMQPHHGDILDFLQLKSPDGGKDDVRCPSIHIALWIPDIFWARLEYWAGHPKETVYWSLFNTATYPELRTLWGPAYSARYEQLEWEGKHMARMPISVIWERIIKAIQEKGEPYMHAKDTINAKSSHINVGPITSSNLCCEIVQYHDETSIAVCNLSSIALPEFVVVMGTKTINFTTVLGPKEHEYEVYSYAFDQLEQTVRQLVRNGNATIDRSESPLEETKRNQDLLRSLAIGVQGQADTYCLFHMPWGSSDARVLNKLLYEHIYYFAVDESNRMAQESGPYPAWDQAGPNGEVQPLKDGKFHWELRGVQPGHLRSPTDSCANSDGASPSYEPLTRAGAGSIELYPDQKTQRGRRAYYISWNKLDWAGLRLRVQKYGVRNSMLIGLMPTMSTSKLLGWTDSFEPSENIYTFKNQTTSSATMINRHLYADLAHVGLFDTNESRKTVVTHIKSHAGSIQTLNMADDIAWLKEVYLTVYEVAPRTLMLLAADTQALVDQSKSQNLFFRAASMKQLTSWYVAAWRLGLKCLSYYVRTQPAAQGHDVAKAATALRAGAVVGKAMPRQLDVVAEVQEADSIAESVGDESSAFSLAPRPRARPAPVETSITKSVLNIRALATPAPQRSPGSAITPAPTNSPTEPQTGRTFEQQLAECSLNARMTGEDCAACSG